MDPHELLPAPQVAGLLGVSNRTLQDWRQDGFGPPFYRTSKIGVVYRRGDVTAWLEARKSGLSLRDATVACVQAAHAVTVESIQHRFAEDPELAEAQRRVADLQLAVALKKATLANEKRAST